MQPETPALLWDAREAATLARQFLGDLTLLEYKQDALRRSAVERQLGIVGEALGAVRKIDAETAASIPDIHRIIGLRHLLAHGYAVIDDAVVWDAVVRHVPDLITTLDDLLGDLAAGR